MTYPYHCGATDRWKERPEIINTLTVWRLVCARTDTASCRRGWGRLQPSLSFTTLLLDKVDPCARVNTKRIKLCYYFGSEATQIRDMVAKRNIFFSLQISNLYCHRESKRDKERIFAFLLSVWTFTKYINNICVYSILILLTCIRWLHIQMDSLIIVHFIEWTNNSFFAYLKCVKPQRRRSSAAAPPAVTSSRKCIPSLFYRLYWLLVHIYLVVRSRAV